MKFRSEGSASTQTKILNIDCNSIILESKSHFSPRSFPFNEISQIPVTNGTDKEHY